MVVVVTEVTTATSEEWGVRESVLRMVARASKLVSGKVKYEDTMYIMNTNWKRARSTTLCVRRRGVQQRMIFLIAVRIIAVQAERASSDAKPVQITTGASTTTISNLHTAVNELLLIKKMSFTARETGIYATHSAYFSHILNEYYVL